MAVLLKLLGVIVILAAIAPIAMAGGRMIAAFMMRKQIVAWVGITLGAMLGVVAGGLLALQVLQPMLGEMLSPLSSVAILVPPWAVFWFGRRFVDGVAQE